MPALPVPRCVRRAFARTVRLACLAGVLGLAACGTPTSDQAAVTEAEPAAADRTEPYRWLNRTTWGATPETQRELQRLGQRAWLAQQLHPVDTDLPPAAREVIERMTLSQLPLPTLVAQLEQHRREADALADDEAKKAARQAYQQALNRLAREAAASHLLRALHSPAQVQEQMTWFWLNHFSVHQGKHNLRALVGDYEDSALRPHALGRFADLLQAAALHPAMLRYLDNEQNAAGRVNENLARELMELHTLGVDGGYSQQDVQELARVLTGVGVNLSGTAPRLRPELERLYVRQGLMEFHPQRHDRGPKQLLGRPLSGQGLAEVREALDRLARHPATARHLSRKLAVFWLADEPPQDLVDRMVRRWQATDGDIAQVLAVLLGAPEFAQAPPGKFKDPMRYVLSALRLAQGDAVAVNMAPVMTWLQRLGEPLYGRATPDGYPMVASAWDSAGQMQARFEVARALAVGSAALYRAEEAGTRPPPVAPPPLAHALEQLAAWPTLGPATRSALSQAGSVAEWNTFFLASPEMMSR